MKYLVGLLVIFLITGCGPKRVTEFKIHKIPGIKWVYETNEDNFPRDQYIKAFSMAAPDKRDWAKDFEDPIVAKQRNSREKAEMYAQGKITHVMALGIEEGYNIIKNQVMESSYIERKYVFPSLSPEDIRIGFTDKQSCYYLGAVKIERLKDILNKTKTETGQSLGQDIINYAHSWIIGTDLVQKREAYMNEIKSLMNQEKSLEPSQTGNAIIFK